MIQFNHYSKPHNNGEGGGGGVTYIRGGVANADLPADLTVTSINAESGDIKRLTGTSLSYNDGGFIYIGADDGTVKKIRGEELNYDIGTIGEIHSGTIDNEGKITTADLKSLKAYIESLQSVDITTEYLTVTKQAHFFELIIDKIKSTNGTLIVTQANCSLDYVKAFDANNTEVDLDANNVNYFWGYWKATDENGKKIDNDWQPYDQAMCMSFNDVQVGVNYDVSSKYYWRLVKDVTSSPVYMNINTGELADANTQTDRNTVHLNMPTLRYTIDVSGTPTSYELTAKWNAHVQILNTDPSENERLTGCTWTESPSQGNTTNGVMTTKNTIWGIQLEPTTYTTTSNNATVVVDTITKIIPDKFLFTTNERCRLNVGLYYTDGNSQYFPAPEKGQAKTSYEFDLVTTAPVEAIVITNADEVAWHQMHGIKLSNISGEYDSPAQHSGDSLYANKSSIPSIGDNVVQLGYRYNHYQESDPEYDEARASAIIISAYKTPDQGEVVGAKTYRGITPPSYAQYKLINDYHLSRHRHTFFDAIGSEFYGEFFAGTGSDTDQYNPLQSEAYHLYIGYANDNGQGQPYNVPYDPVDHPNGWVKTNPIGGQSYEFMGFCTRAIVVQTGETEQAAINRIEATLTFNDYEWSMVPGGTGTPGGHWVNAYKNTQSKNTAPNLPNVNGVPKTLSELPYDGWYETPQTLPDGYYTWMSQAFLDGNGNMQLWQTAIRLTGGDGTPGTDGDEIEFIYTRNNGDQDGDPLTPPAPPTSGTYPDDWPNDGTTDHQTVTNYVDGEWVNTTWYDNPQGVEENMRYEYVSQRMKRNGSWLIYSDPVVWSSWGRKGQDGDGYEYIYCQVGPQGPQGYQGPQAPPTPVAPGPGDEQYPAPWTDDPSGVSSIWPQEYVSTRKKSGNQGWSTYSPPALWAQYVPPGTQGPQGPQGNTGLNGSGYKLIDVGSIAYYEVGLNANNDTTMSLHIILKYKIAKIVGTTVQYLSTTELDNLPLRPYVKLSMGTNTVDYKYYPFMYETAGANEAVCTFTWEPSSSSDIEKFIADNTISNLPVVLVPRLPQDANDTFPISDSILGQIQDQTSVPVIMGSNAELKIVKGDGTNGPSIKAIVTNQESQGQAIATLGIQANQIQGQVTNLSNDMSNKVDQSTLTQTANSIRSEVVEIYNNSDGYAKLVTVDLISYEENNTTNLYDTTKFYPVAVSLPPFNGTQSAANPYGTKKFPVIHIRVSRKIDQSYGGPDYSTHHVDNDQSKPIDGFLFTLELSTTPGGNGQAWTTDQSKPHNNEPLFVNKLEVGYTQAVNGIPEGYIVPIIEQNYIGSLITGAGNDEIIYLRGGSKYDIESSWTGSTITAYTSGYNYTGFNKAVISYDSNIDPIVQDLMSHSKIEQTARDISLEVTTDGVQAAGIYLNGPQSYINLYADKVTFCSGIQGAQGFQSGKIWIDNVDATLHAENADINGKLTANLFYSKNERLSYSGREATQDGNKYYVNAILDPTKNDPNTYWPVAANNYICESGDGSSSIMPRLRITLPTPSSYPGLEYNFYIYRESQASGWPYIRYSSNWSTQSPDIVFESSNVNSSSTNIIPTTNYITLKAIDNKWYVINGTATAVLI